MAEPSLILNNREVAIALWLVVPAVLLLIKFADVRKSTYSLIKSFFCRKISLLLAAVFIPIAWSLVILAHYQILEVYMLKTTAFWFITAGLVMSFKVTEIMSKESFMRQTASKLFKATLALEFLINLYVFPLFIELFLVPTTVALAMMLVVIETQKQQKDYKQIQRFIGGLLSLIGAGLFIFTLGNILAQPGLFFTLANLKLFLLPIALTLMHMPAVYFLALYFAYERMFATLSHLYPSFAGSRRVKLVCLGKCNMHIGLVRKMHPFLVREIIPSLSEEDILRLIRRF